MNPETVDYIVRLLRWHGWIPLLSLLVGAFIRVSKSDPKVAWFPNYIKPVNRPVWALGLAIAGGVLEQAFAGGTALEAIVGGIIAGNTAIAGHELVEKVRRGRAIRSLPPAPPPDWLDDSLSPPPPPPPPRMPPMFPKLAALVFGLALVLVFYACAYRQAVCQAIDLANKVCPFILVQMPDGTTERIPVEVVEVAAVRVRIARMKRIEAGAEPDGGTE